MTQSVGWNVFVDTQAQIEQRRLRLLEQVFDPFTHSNLQRTGVAYGQRCLEVGAGAGSIARRMAELVGADNVLATDVSTAFLEPLRELGIAVLEHDVTTDESPGSFDLIHARFVLEHLVEREAVLRRLASWLRPGGWLVIEIGTTLPALSSHPATARSMTTLNETLRRHVGTDPGWARTFPVPLEQAGLVECGAEGRILPARGQSPLAGWLKETTKLAEKSAVASGMITQAELDEAYALYDDPDFVDYTWMTVATWGRRAQ
ncbi:MAG: methyltransferase [Kibdelosporangium sp.]